MNNEDVKPIADMEISKIISYGDSNNKIEVQTVASYINYFNYLSTPDYTIKYNLKDGVRISEEFEKINYLYEENKNIELLFSQIEVIVLNGIRYDKDRKTKELLAEFLQYYSKLGIEALKDIHNNSKERFVGLDLMVHNLTNI